MLFDSLKLFVNWNSNIGFGQLEIYKDEQNDSYHIRNEFLNKQSILHILKKLVSDVENSDVSLQDENDSSTNIFEKYEKMKFIRGLRVLKKGDERLYVTFNEKESTKSISKFNHFDYDIILPLPDDIKAYQVVGDINDDAMSIMNKYKQDISFINKFLGI